MWIRTRPASANISLEARAPASDRPVPTQEIVSFELLPTNERDHLNLDTGEVFQDYSYAMLHKKEDKLIGASITIRAIPDDSFINTMLCTTWMRFLTVHQQSFLTYLSRRRHSDS